MNKILFVVALFLMSGCAATVTNGYAYAPRAHVYQHPYYYYPYYGYSGVTFFVAPTRYVTRVSASHHHHHRNDFKKRVDKRRHQ